MLDPAPISKANYNKRHQLKSSQPIKLNSRLLYIIKHMLSISRQLHSIWWNSSNFVKVNESICFDIFLRVTFQPLLTLKIQFMNVKNVFNSVMFQWCQNSETLLVESQGCRIALISSFCNFHKTNSLCVEKIIGVERCRVTCGMMSWRLRSLWNFTYLWWSLNIFLISLFRN